jgi:tetratricopeptide (TPR) repeat protein
VRKTAKDAFENIDHPLEQGIARWKQAIERSPNANDVSMFSAHWELAQLAEQRDELELAAAEYETCRTLKPQLPSLLLDLARVWQQLGRVDDAAAALIAAMWGKDPRTAERAKEAFGMRYPFVYEFRMAIKLDPSNAALGRELGYLFLALQRDADAVPEFQRVVRIDPNDRLAVVQLAALRVPHPTDASTSSRSTLTSGARANSGAAAIGPKTMAQRSMAAGYVKDAIRYYLEAFDRNPDDAEAAIGLGWAYNVSGNDREALHWFYRASRMDNETIAHDADRAYHNLTSGGVPEITFWALPLYSSRWQDTFGYAQMKARLPVLKGTSPVQLYFSMRMIGDTRETVGSKSTPEYLSEDAVIAGVGMSTRTWHHLVGWAEAGEAISYLPDRHDIGRATPDYRGGVNLAKGFGQLLGSNHSGFYYETTADTVYISRFDKDTLFYSQNRAGRTFRLSKTVRLQLLGNVNATTDLKSQYWANTVEVGPGMRVPIPFMPPNAYFLTDYMRGFYIRPDEYTPKHDYHDFRIGLWYAFSH